MYSVVTVRDVVRIPPKEFGAPIEEAAMVHLRKQHENVLDRDIGLMIAVIGIEEIGQGRLMPGDGATYHSVTYQVLVFKPIRGEIVEGNVVELMVMDAEKMAFADDSFDKVVAMYVASVVPDPKRLVDEMRRVCKPQGQIFMVNHFHSRNVVLGGC